MPFSFVCKVHQKQMYRKKYSSLNILYLFNFEQHIYYNFVPILLTIKNWKGKFQNFGGRSPLLRGHFSLSLSLAMRLLSCFLCLKRALFICVQGASQTNVQKKIQQHKYVILILFWAVYSAESCYDSICKSIYSSTFSTIV